MLEEFPSWTYQQLLQCGSACDHQKQCWCLQNGGELNEREKRKPFRPEFHTDKIKLCYGPCHGICSMHQFFIFEQIHTGVDRIDAVFSSNAAINDLSDTLNKLEGTVYEYLNIKGTKALENYYRYGAGLPG